MLNQLVALLLAEKAGLGIAQGAEPPSEGSERLSGDKALAELDAAVHAAAKAAAEAPAQAEAQAAPSEPAVREAGADRA